MDISNNILDKFNNTFNSEILKEDLKNVSSGNGDFREVPVGIYDVTIEKLELTESKSGKPMITSWMKIISGEYKNSMLFMNQVIITGYGLHIANEFLRSLETGIVVEFEDYKQYHELLIDIHQTVQGREFVIGYGENKGFKTFAVLDRFESIG